MRPGGTGLGGTKALSGRQTAWNLDKYAFYIKCQYHITIFSKFKCMN